MKEKPSLQDSHPELAIEADGWDAPSPRPNAVCAGVVHTMQSAHAAHLCPKPRNSERANGALALCHD